MDSKVHAGEAVKVVPTNDVSCLIKRTTEAFLRALGEAEM